MTTDLRSHLSLLLEHNLEAGRGDQPAIITHDGTQLTYTDIYRQACGVASHLREIGVRREERILMVMDDTPGFHAAFLGANRVGALPVPVNFLARADDFGYFLDDSYATVAI